MKARRITLHKTKHLYAVSAVLLLGIIGTYAYTFGKISSHDTKLSNHTSDASSPSLPSLLRQPVDIESAREIAQAQKPGVSVTKVTEATPANGAPTYVVHFTDGTKVDVNATNGAIVKDSSPETSSTSTDSVTASPSENPATSSTSTDSTDETPDEDEVPPSDTQNPLPPADTNP